MKRLYIPLFLIIILSLVGNLFFLFTAAWSEEKREEECSHIHEENDENISLFNRPESVDYETIQYDTYALDGSPVLFLNFLLQGTITESVEKKYHTKVPLQLIRNIQNIVYFFSDFKLKFRKNDRISIYYRQTDNKILYMRYKNRSRRSINEAFLFDDGFSERYFTTEGKYLVPCLVNGPFEGCPDARLINDRHGMIPVFSLPPQSSVHLPFKAKMMEIGKSRKHGGQVQITYSNFMKNAWFKGFSHLSTDLKKGELYRKDTLLGKGGYRKENKGMDGVSYYLLNKDGSLQPPFLFHHISYRAIDEQLKNNFDIAVRYYQRLYKRGKSFEKVFFVK